MDSKLILSQIERTVYFGKTYKDCVFANKLEIMLKFGPSCVFVNRVSFLAECNWNCIVDGSYPISMGFALSLCRILGSTLEFCYVVAWSWLYLWTWVISFVDMAYGKNLFRDLALFSGYFQIQWRCISHQLVKFNYAQWLEVIVDLGCVAPDIWMLKPCTKYNL